jgi:beta-glucanase (GH16 family)
VLDLLRRTLLCGALPLVVLGGCSPASPDPRQTSQPPIVWERGNWAIVWQDEFEGPAGQAPDKTHWAHEIGGNGWGNKELQYYTDSTDNVALDGAGSLLVTARKEPFMGNAYTSGRLTTKGIFEQAYGRFEARMKLAAGVGMWPAFWIMGGNIDEAGWPGAGEIDIMEQRGYDLRNVLGSLHGPDASGKDVPIHYTGRSPDDINTNFHVYAIEWDMAGIVFLLDDTPYAQVTTTSLPINVKWVYDHPFFIILNLAVGGVFGGDPNANTVTPQSIAIDYVRVSTRKP